MFKRQSSIAQLAKFHAVYANLIPSIGIGVHNLKKLCPFFYRFVKVIVFHIHAALNQVWVYILRVYFMGFLEILIGFYVFSLICKGKALHVHIRTATS